MTKRLQVLLHQEEYSEIQSIARGSRVSVSEWVRQTLRIARGRRTTHSVREIATAYLTHGAGVDYTTGMTKRLQVVLDEEELMEIQDIARGQRLTVAEWVRQSLRTARHERPGATDVKLRAIAEAYRYFYPTGDIDSLLDEIEAGRQLQ